MGILELDEHQDQNIYQTFFRNFPDTIYTMDLMGNIMSVNNSVVGFLGYSSNEIQGSFHQFVKNKHLNRTIKHFQLAVSGQVQQYNCSCVHKDGHFVDVTVTNIPMFSNGEVVGIYGIAKDLTEQKLTEARLKENEIQFQQIYESLNLGVWSWDIRFHKLIYVSSGIETLSGLKQVDLMDGTRKWKEIIYPEDKTIIEQNQIELRKGKPCKYQYRIIDMTGNVKWVDARTFPILDSDGELVRIDGLVTDIHEKKLQDEKINYYAYHDYLTGLPSRRMFEAKLEQLMMDESSSTEKFALLYLDLDRFKFVNDTLGHSIGDELLKKVSERLAKHLTGNDLLARIGGDEFAIILNHYNDSTEPTTIAFNIIKDFQRSFAIKEYDLHITTSIGIGIFPQDGLTVNDLCANTDVALYRAKGIGKNNLQLYSPCMNLESYKLFVLENDLRRAIHEEQFILHYQPKVDPISRKIMGAEALIRWNHPDWGILPPDEFIPLAEETNLIIELGDWVMAKVCKQIKQWLEGGQDIVPISINISAKRFLKDDLVSKLLKILEETNVKSKWLEFEITETSLIQNEEKVLSIINTLKEIGITISLDDFGTGYSSISYLKKFKVDYLKIDRSFIKSIHTNEDDDGIVKTILFLARELKIKVVAEGVETKEQLSFLQKHQCDLIQGYLFSRPVEVEAFTRLITKDRIRIQRKADSLEVIQ